ncbi:MAG: EipA family protein [Bacteroidota bacterium]|jgi:hypothetical protein
MVAAAAFACLGAAQAQTCSRDAFAKIVNDSGAALRRLSAESQPKLQAGFRKLKEKNGWREEDYLDKASALLSDERTEAFDQKSSELLARLDRLADEAPNAPDACSRLAELEATALELQATVRAKTEHQLARLNEAIGESAAAKPQPKPLPGTAPQAKAPPKERPAAKEPAAAPREQAGKDRTPPKSMDKGWSVSSNQQPSSAEQAIPPMQGGGVTQLPPIQAPSEDGYTIDEIRSASRGFFGNVSTGLASVIEYAFAKLGRPTGYVLGNEGGGALIAGVRYGKGMLYLREGGTREVYWHGPSIGYDLGAAGSKTMFLIYRLRNPESLFSGFSGIDGSAYVVGGVGLTLLTDGNTVMAPIRSGLGLRVGANIGYIRFTPRPTWNPF